MDAELEYKTKEAKLIRKINKSKKASKANLTLAQKLVIKAEVKLLEESLRLHRLNKFEMC